ncbi:MAG: recombinase family protein [Peptococcaceae bacterium]|nr:recombinase family protein [Peptococcaceae bacterium]
MRAAIYVRVSTEDQARHGYSLAEQKEACRLRAQKLGATTILEFADEGVSGASLDRPGLQELREAIRAGQINLVVVRDPDRLSRKLSHQLLLTEEFEKAGINLEFLDFDWKDTPEGRLFYSIRGAIAEYEREKIRDRMVRGKNQKAKLGGIPIGFYVYGYNYNPETEQVKLNEDESEVVRNIFNWFINEDIGVNGVARRLNEKAVPTRKGKKWHKQVVKQILVNPVYVGSWKYKDIHITVPSIIDDATWLRAQDKIKEARRLWAGKGKHDYLLSGIITCADCGCTMTGIYALWWRKRARRYSCHKGYQGAKQTGCLPRKMILAEYVEDAVWNQVKEWLKDPDALLSEAYSSMPQMDEYRKELVRIEKLLAEVEKGRESVLDALASGLFELDAKIKGKLADLKRRRERLEQRRKELLFLLNGTAGAEARVDELKILANEILDRIDELEFDEKKALVRALVASVLVSGRGRPGGRGLDKISITIVARLPEPVNAEKEAQFSIMEINR